MKTANSDSIFQSKQEPDFLQQISALGQHWKWILIAGTLHILLGFIALVMPPPNTIELTYNISALLIVSGLIQMVQALRLRHQRGGGTYFFESALSIIIGSLLLRYPSGGVVGVALSLSFYFLIGAILQWIFFSEMRPHAGWSWGLISSFISFLMGAFIVTTFPFVALWVPGTLLGVEFLISGSGMIGFALSVQKYQFSLRDEMPREEGLYGADKTYLEPTIL